MGALRRWLASIAQGGPVYALLLLFGLNLASWMDQSGYAILVPEIRNAFGLSDSGVLSLVAVASLVGLGMQVPIAQLADRYSRVRLMLVGAMVCASFVLGTGLATSVLLLVLMRAGSGFGQATVGPTHNSLISDWFPINARPKVYAFHYAAGSVGAFVGPLMVGLIAHAYGWRIPFFVLAVPTLLFVLLGLKLREPSRGIQERRAMGVVDALETEEPPPSFAEGWRMVWKIESLRRIFWAMPFLAASLIGFGSLASLLYQQRFHLDVATRGWLAAAAEPVQIVGLVVAARVGSRLIQRDPGLIIRFLAVVAVACSGLLVLFALVPILWVTVVVNMAVSAALAAVGSGIYSSLSLAIPPRSRSLGFSMGALWVIPGLLVLPIVGAISDHLGIQWGMLAVVPVFLFGGLLLSTAGRVIDRDIAQVRTMAAARSEVLYARRQGEVKLLLLRGVSVAYGQVQVLFDVDLEVAEGEIVALLGTNGAGKSTLLKAICGVAEADKGAVVFDGLDITHAPPWEIARHGVAMVPGGQGVFPGLSVEENLSVAGWADPKGCRERWGEVFAMFPILEQRRRSAAADLSGGQQQMLALSMAFLARPRLLLIDELSLGLAPVVVEQLLPMVEALGQQGTTVVLVEQSVNLALTVASTAYFMEKGEIRFHGPTAELLERPDILRSVFLEGAGAQLAGTSAAAPRPVATPAAPSPAPAPGPSLELRDISVRFGGVEAVGEVSLAVAPGEVLGVIGPNGAGKTTLFDLISGFTRADQGAVLLAGRDVTGLSADRRARLGLGRSFQDARLFPAMTVAETLATALERWLPVTDPLNAALHLPGQVDADELVARRVEELLATFGLESMRDKYVRELSTGSRRMVDLACCVAHRPSVLLLDEPSSGVAQRETEALGPLLLQLRDMLGASLLVVEHDMALLGSVADRVVALDQGRMLAEGSTATVLADPLVAKAYLGTSGAALRRSGSSGSIETSEGGAP